jgi:hypothetical protein
VKITYEEFERRVRDSSLCVECGQTWELHIYCRECDNEVCGWKVTNSDTMPLCDWCIDPIKAEPVFP